MDPKSVIREKIPMCQNCSFLIFFTKFSIHHFPFDTLWILPAGVTDFVCRSEYQGRKALHWHMAARTLGIRMEDIQNACRKYDFDVRCSTEEEQQMNPAQMQEYRLHLISEGFNPDKPSSEELKAVVAESREKVIEFVTKDLGLSAVHPQADPKQWPGPEGLFYFYISHN